MHYNTYSIAYSSRFVTLTVQTFAFSSLRQTSLTDNKMFVGDINEDGIKTETDWNCLTLRRYIPKHTTLKKQKEKNIISWNKS